MGNGHNKNCSIYHKSLLSTLLFYCVVFNNYFLTD